MATDDLAGAIERSHHALDQIVKGNPEPFQLLFSERDDVTLGNPFGPFARGRDDVVATIARAAANYRDGTATGVDLVATYATDELACVVEVETLQAKIGARDDMATVSLRLTSLFRLEDATWRLVHRHAGSDHDAAAARVGHPSVTPPGSLA